jgi:hypothetical protein
MESQEPGSLVFLASRETVASAESNIFLELTETMITFFCFSLLSLFPSSGPAGGSRQQFVFCCFGKRSVFVIAMVLSSNAAMLRWELTPAAAVAAAATILCTTYNIGRQTVLVLWQYCGRGDLFPIMC